MLIRGFCKDIEGNSIITLNDDISFVGRWIYWDEFGTILDAETLHPSSIWVRLQSASRAELRNITDAMEHELIIHATVTQQIPHYYDVYNEPIFEGDVVKTYNAFDGIESEDLYKIEYDRFFHKWLATFYKDPIYSTQSQLFLPVDVYKVRTVFNIKKLHKD